MEEKQEHYILALDHGTTSTRAVLFDSRARIKAIAQKETSLSYPHHGWVELDVDEVWLASLSVITDVIKKARISFSQIDALGLCNQRETTVLWDSETGLPVYPAIVWQSRQSEAICRQWKEEGFEELISSITGLRIDPYFSASKIVWILQNVEEARILLERGRLLFGTMDSYLVWKMSGGKRHITDLSNASRTMLVDIQSGTWSQELLDLFGIPRSILPEIVSNSEIYTETEPGVFFHHAIPVASMIGDQQSALFGQLCLKKGMVKNTYGTGGFLLMNTGQEIVRSRQGLLSTVAWKLGDQITYALEGSVFVSGSVMKWLRDQLEILEETKYSESIAHSLKEEQPIYIVPAFVGLGTPYWNEKARAAILGLSFNTRKEHLVKAALESMAFQVKDVLDQMEKDSGIEVSQLKVDGGAAVNNFLLQFQADLLQKEVIRYTVHELTALGAALLAGLACGFYQLENLSLQPDRIFWPKKPREEMEERYRLWKRAVKACELFSQEEL